MAKKEEYKRKRRRLNIMLSDKAHEFLKNRVTNASKFIERLIDEADKGIQATIVTVSTKESGLVVIRTRDLRRVKATS